MVGRGTVYSKKHSAIGFGATQTTPKPRALPRTTTTTNNGFVKPEPALAGKFCRAIARNHALFPSVNPSGVSADSNPWGPQVTVAPNASTSTLDDLAAVQSASNGTSVIQQAWQTNGYQYAGLSIACLNGYDLAFHWVAATSNSANPTEISTSFTSEHSLLAVRSATGTCWYVLNVMTSGDPIIDADDLQSYGVFSAIGPGSRCAAVKAPGYGLWQSMDPLPPQLQQ